MGAVYKARDTRLDWFVAANQQPLTAVIDFLKEPGKTAGGLTDKARA
jgi:hypothetical protein